MFECLKVWKFERLSAWVFGNLNIWMFECLKVWVFECLNVWMFVWKFEFLNVFFESLKGWMFECLKVWTFECLNAWMLECFSVWMFEWRGCLKFWKFEWLNVWTCWFSFKYVRNTRMQCSIHVVLFATTYVSGCSLLLAWLLDLKHTQLPNAQGEARLGKLVTWELGSWKVLSMFECLHVWVFPCASMSERSNLQGFEIFWGLRV